MIRKAFGRIAVVLLVVGLALAPAGVGGAFAKSKKSESSKSVKKDKKDKSKKDKGKKDKGKKVKKGAKSKKDKKSKNDKKSRKKDKSAKKSTKSEPVAAKRTARAVPAPASSASSYRGKNEDSYTASNSTTVASGKRQPEPSYVSDGNEADEADEPDLPKPANRVVADIASSRVTQIQAALIKQGLLVGPPNGVYDQATFSAMATFQTRNGWNPVGVPTASSLKALGVPKNSGRPYPTPSRVVDETAPTP